jgi:hypothetical protein
VPGSLVIVASTPGGGSCEPDNADNAESSRLFNRFNASVELRRPSDDLLLTPLLPVWIDSRCSEYARVLLLYSRTSEITAH